MIKAMVYYFEHRSDATKLRDALDNSGLVYCGDTLDRESGLTVKDDGTEVWAILEDTNREAADELIRGELAKLGIVPKTMKIDFLDEIENK